MKLIKVFKEFEKSDIKFDCIENTYKYLNFHRDPTGKNSNPSKAIYFRVKLDNKVISSCYIIFFGDNKYVYISDVKSRQTSKGYGSLLIQKLKEYLKPIGVNSIYLGCEKKNVGAQKFYEKEGFKNIGDYSDTYHKYFLKF